MKLTTLFLLAISALIIISCGTRIKGEGDVTEQRHDLPEFTEIQIGGVYEVVLTSGSNNPGITVVTNENIHDHIEIKVDHGELHIGSRDKYFDADELRLEIETDYIEEIDVSGAVDVEAFDLDTEEAEVSVTGAGEVDVRVEKSLDVSITGAGEVNYIGSPEVSEFITGAGEIKQVKR